MNIKQQKTKIIATVGPACNTYEKLIDLVNAGVDVFRLNFSHGTHEDHKVIIEFVTKINENFPVNIAILADLQGPKLRIGKVENDVIELKENDELIFTQEKIIGNDIRRDHWQCHETRQQCKECRACPSTLPIVNKKDIHARDLQ